MLKDIQATNVYSLASGNIYKVSFIRPNGYETKFYVLSRGTGNCQMSIVENFNSASNQLDDIHCKYLLRWIADYFDRRQVLLDLNLSTYNKYPFLADWAIVNQPYQNHNGSEMVLLIVKPE